VHPSSPGVDHETCRSMVTFRPSPSRALRGLISVVPAASAGARVPGGLPPAHAAAREAVDGRRDEVWSHDGGRRRRRV
jgi:hypothetical protein